MHPIRTRSAMFYVASLAAMTVACLSPVVEVPWSVGTQKHALIIPGWQAAYMAIPLAGETDLGFRLASMLALFANLIYLVVLLLLLIRLRCGKPRYKYMAFAAAGATLSSAVTLLLLRLLQLHFGAGLWVLSSTLLFIALRLTTEPSSPRGFPIFIPESVPAALP